MIATPSAEIKEFQHFIFSWYKKNKRDLPWRKTQNPYKILISEVMSQQTQIGRVIPKYTIWVKKFPTVSALANASTRDVLSVWSGLGYNRRALHLKKCAEEVVTRYKGIFPSNKEALLSFSGIGEYTANAILCFAFHKKVALIDTNIKKVIAIHFYNGNVPKPKVLQELACALLPKRRTYIWNQALMDYASAELKKEKIVIPKQTKFIGSNRYYRGQIIKYLLRNKSASHEELMKLFKENIHKDRLQIILNQLQKESLIISDQKNHYFLP